MDHVRGDFLGPHHVTKAVAVIANKIKNCDPSGEHIKVSYGFYVVDIFPGSRTAGSFALEFFHPKCMTILVPNTCLISILANLERMHL